MHIKLATYNAPARNRNKMMEIVFIAKADENEKMNAPNAATRKTFRRPQVSAKNPQRCDVKTIPKYEIALRSPCSSVDKFRSHFAYGKIKPILVFSNADPNMLIPVQNVRMS